MHFSHEIRTSSATPLRLIKAHHPYRRQFAIIFFFFFFVLLLFSIKSYHLSSEWHWGVCWNEHYFKENTTRKKNELTIGVTNKKKMTNTHKHTREHHRGMCEVIKKKNCSCYTTDYTIIFITHSVDALSFFVLFLHSLLADKI